MTASSASITKRQTLALFAGAHSVLVLALAGLMIGITASAVHVLVPFAAHLAPEDQKGSAVGIVLSALLLGILLPRTASRYISQWLDWRAMYILASGFMLIAAFGVRAMLPSQKPDVNLSWLKLLSSAWTLIRQQPVVRDVTLISALLFFAFSAFWTTLAFFLAGDHYSYGAAAAGNFGLVGAIGALAAPLLGKLADRFSARRNVFLTIIVTSISFVVMALWGNYLAGLIVGVVLLDIGMQGTSEELRKEVLADQSSALEARQTAVEWGLAPAVTDTDPFAHGGYKLASRLLRNDRSLIESLVQELCAVETMSQEQLQSWFDRHADSLVLEELERSVTF